MPRGMLFIARDEPELRNTPCLLFHSLVIPTYEKMSGVHYLSYKKCYICIG